MRVTLRNSAWLLLRLALAALLLGWTLRQVLAHSPAIAAPGGLRALFAGWDLALAAGALPCLAAAQLFSALRWRALLALQGQHLRVWDVLRLTWLAEFGTLALPGSLGGDAVRMLAAARGTPRRTAGVISVMADRLIGVGTMVAVAAAALAGAWVTGAPRGAALHAATLTVVVASAALGGVVLLLGVPGLCPRALWQWLCRRPKLGPLVAEAGTCVARYRQHMPGLAVAWGFSLGVQAAEIGAVIMLGLSLQLPLGWSAYALYVPLINLISAVPITPGALGVTEWLYVAFLGVAADPGRVLGLALLARAGLLVRALPGALLAIGGSPLAARDVTQRPES